MDEPNPIDVAVGLRIRARREAMNLGQRDLAQAIGVTFQQVQKYEKAINRVGASRLERIAAVLHVSPSFFFAPSSVSPKAPPHQDEDDLTRFVATREGQQLNRLFCRIRNPAIRTKLVELVKAASRSAEKSKHE